MEGNIYTKSNERVKQFGEVFTPEDTVNNMMDLPGIKEESYKLESTWLEPSCGTGNFLVEILFRKLQAAKRLAMSGRDYDLCVIEAFCNTYGVDIQSDNVSEAQERMFNVFKEQYTKDTGSEPSSELCEAIKFIMTKNIIFGNMLSFKMIEQKYRKSRRATHNRGRMFKVSMEACIDDNNIDKQSIMKFWKWSIEDGKVYGQEFSGQDDFALSSKFGGVDIPNIINLSPNM